MTITTIGIDIGKSWFHIIGLNRAGKPVLKEKRQRSNLMTLFVNTPPCLIGMDACPGSQRIDYNDYRPHSSLGQLTPMEFVDQYQQQRAALG